MPQPSALPTLVFHDKFSLAQSRLAPTQAHIWDAKKQVYLGGFDSEVAAAKAHDVMAVKTRGPKTLINFKVAVYAELLPFLADEDLTRVSVGTDTPV